MGRCFRTRESRHLYDARIDTDKLAIPVWSLAALIAAIDVFYADKEEFVGE